MPSGVLSGALSHFLHIFPPFGGTPLIFSRFCSVCAYFFIKFLTVCSYFHKIYHRVSFDFGSLAVRFRRAQRHPVVRRRVRVRAEDGREQGRRAAEPCAPPSAQDAAQRVPPP